MWGEESGKESDYGYIRLKLHASEGAVLLGFGALSALNIEQSCSQIGATGQRNFQ
jgi:hypothetical protein